MKRDLENRKDIENLLSEFYKFATKDAEIGHHFADLDLAAHLPVIVDFWEKILFGKPVYFGNPLAVHRAINLKSPLTLKHFQRWFDIFSRTIDENFAGETAENAKLRAKMIAHSLNRQINNQPVKINSSIA